mgnify:CR=1 FL=1
MHDPTVLDRNRVILCHFDSYSAALLFARYGSSVLAPTPLPEAASAMPAPEDAGEHYAPAAVLDALAAIGMPVSADRAVVGGAAGLVAFHAAIAARRTGREGFTDKLPQPASPQAASVDDHRSPV